MSLGPYPLSRVQVGIEKKKVSDKGRTGAGRSRVLFSSQRTGDKVVEGVGGMGGDCSQTGRVLV